MAEEKTTYGSAFTIEQTKTLITPATGEKEAVYRYEFGATVSFNRIADEESGIMEYVLVYTDKDTGRTYTQTLNLTEEELKESGPITVKTEELIRNGSYTAVLYAYDWRGNYSTTEERDFDIEIPVSATEDFYTHTTAARVPEENLENIVTASDNGSLVQKYLDSTYSVIWNAFGASTSDTFSYNYSLEYSTESDFSTKEVIDFNEVTSDGVKDVFNKDTNTYTYTFGVAENEDSKYTINLNSGETYYFRLCVTAQDLLDSSYSYSNPQYTTYTEIINIYKPLTPVVKSTAVGVEDNVITIGWTTASPGQGADFDGYVLEIFSDADRTDLLKTAYTTSLSTTFKASAYGLVENETYFYTVRSINKNDLVSARTDAEVKSLKTYDISAPTTEGKISFTGSFGELDKRRAVITVNLPEYTDTVSADLTYTFTLFTEVTADEKTQEKTKKILFTKTLNTLAEDFSTTFNIEQFIDKTLIQEGSEYNWSLTVNDNASKYNRGTDNITESGGTIYTGSWNDQQPAEITTRPSNSARTGSGTTTDPYLFNYNAQTNPGWNNNNITISWTAPDVIDGKCWTQSSSGAVTASDWEITGYTLTITDKDGNNILTFDMDKRFTTIQVQNELTSSGVYLKCGYVTSTGSWDYYSYYAKTYTATTEYGHTVLFREREEYTYTVTVNTNYDTESFSENLTVITGDYDTLQHRSATAGTFKAYDITAPQEGDAKNNILTITFSDPTSSTTTIRQLDLSASWDEFADSSKTATSSGVTYQLQIMNSYYSSWDYYSTTFDLLWDEETEKWTLTEAAQAQLQACVGQGTHYYWRVKATDTSDLTTNQNPLNPQTHVSYGSVQEFYTGSWTQQAAYDKVYSSTGLKNNDKNDVLLYFDAPAIAGKDWENSADWKIDHYTFNFYKSVSKTLDDGTVVWERGDLVLSVNTELMPLINSASYPSVTVNNRADAEGKFSVTINGTSYYVTPEKGKTSTLPDGTVVLFDDLSSYEYTIQTTNTYKKYDPATSTNPKTVFSDDSTDDRLKILKNSDETTLGHFTTYDTVAPIEKKASERSETCYLSAAAPMTDNNAPSITVYWDPFADESTVTYYIQYSTESLDGVTLKSGNYYTVGTYTADSEEQQGKKQLSSQDLGSKLNQGQQYYWRVVAKDEAGHYTYGETQTLYSGGWAAQNTVSVTTRTADGTTNDVTLGWTMPSIGGVTNWTVDAKGTVSGTPVKFTDWKLSIYDKYDENDAPFSFTLKYDDAVSKILSAGKTVTVQIKDIVTEKVYTEGDTEIIYNADGTVITGMTAGTKIYYTTVTVLSNQTVPVGTYKVKVNSDQLKTIHGVKYLFTEKNSYHFDVTLNNDYEGLFVQGKVYGNTVSDNINTSTLTSYYIYTNDITPPEQTAAQTTGTFSHTVTHYSTEYTGDLVDGPYFTMRWNYYDASDIQQYLQISADKEALESTTTVASDVMSTADEKGFHTSEDGAVVTESYSYNYSKDRWLYYYDSYYYSGKSSYWRYWAHTETSGDCAYYFDIKDFDIEEGTAYYWRWAGQETSSTQRQTVGATQTFYTGSWNAQGKATNLTADTTDGINKVNISWYHPELISGRNWSTDKAEGEAWKFETYTVDFYELNSSGQRTGDAMFSITINAENLKPVETEISPATETTSAVTADIATVTVQNKLGKDELGFYTYVKTSTWTSDKIYLEEEQVHLLPNGDYVLFDSLKSYDWTITIKNNYERYTGDKNVISKDTTDEWYNALKYSSESGGKFVILDVVPPEELGGYDVNYNESLQTMNASWNAFDDTSSLTYTFDLYDDSGVKVKTAVQTGTSFSWDSKDYTFSRGKQYSWVLTAKDSSGNSTSVNGHFWAGTTGIENPDQYTIKNLGQSFYSATSTDVRLEGAMVVKGDEQNYTIQLDNNAKFYFYGTLESTPIVSKTDVSRRGFILHGISYLADGTLLFKSADQYLYVTTEWPGEDDTKSGTTVRAAGVYAEGDLTVSGYITPKIAKSKEETRKGISVVGNDTLYVYGITAANLNVTGGISGQIEAAGDKAKAVSAISTLDKSGNITFDQAFNNAVVTAELGNNTVSLSGSRVTAFEGSNVTFKQQVNGTIKSSAVVKNGNSNTVSALYAANTMTLSGGSVAEIAASFKSADGNSTGTNVSAVSANTIVVAKGLSGSLSAENTGSGGTTAVLNAGGNITIDTVSGALSSTDYSGLSTLYGIKGSTVSLDTLSGSLTVLSEKASELSVTGIKASTLKINKLKGTIDVTGNTSGLVSGLNATAITVNEFSGKMTVKNIDGNAFGFYDTTGKLELTLTEGSELNVSGAAAGTYAIYGAGGLNLTINGTIESSSGHAITSYLTGSVLTDNVKDNVVLNECATVTGDIDLYGGTNTIMIDSRATLNGHISGYGGTTNILFDLAVGATTSAKAVTVINTDTIGSLDTTETTYAIDLNTASKGYYKLLTSTSGLNAESWAGRSVGIYYNGKTATLHVNGGSVVLDGKSVRASFVPTGTAGAGSVVVMVDKGVSETEVTLTYDAEKGTVNWGTAGAVTAYTLQYRKSGETDWNNSCMVNYWKVGDTIATSCALADILQKNTDYDFRVMAVYDDGSQSEWENLLSSEKTHIQVADATKPVLSWNAEDKITNGSVVGEHTGIYLTWSDANAGNDLVDHYELEIVYEGKTYTYKVGTETYIAEDETSEANETETKVEVEQPRSSKTEKLRPQMSAILRLDDTGNAIKSGTYTVTLKACDKDGSVLSSLEKTDVTVTDSYTDDVLAPENLKAVLSGATATLTWDGAYTTAGEKAGSTYYIYEYSTVSDFSKDVTSAQFDGCEIRIAGLVNYQKYYWRVKTVSTVKEGSTETVHSSDWSDTHSFQIYVKDTEIADLSKAQTESVKFTQTEGQFGGTVSFTEITDSGSGIMEYVLSYKDTQDGRVYSQKLEKTGDAYKTTKLVRAGEYTDAVLYVYDWAGNSSSTAVESFTVDITAADKPEITLPEDMPSTDSPLTVEASLELAKKYETATYTVSWEDPIEGGSFRDTYGFSYSLEYSLDSTFKTGVFTVANPTLTGTTYSQTFAITGETYPLLEAGKTYYFHVKTSAYDKLDGSYSYVKYSDISSLEVITVSGPEAPTNVQKSVSLTDNTTVITWTAPEGDFAGYVVNVYYMNGEGNRVYIDNTGKVVEGAGSITVGKTETSYTQTGLTDNQHYYYEVISYDKNRLLNTDTTSYGEFMTYDISAPEIEEGTEEFSGEYTPVEGKSTKQATITFTLPEASDSSTPLSYTFKLVRIDGTKETVIEKERALTEEEIGKNQVVLSSLAEGKHYRWTISVTDNASEANKKALEFNGVEGAAGNNNTTTADGDFYTGSWTVQSAPVVAPAPSNLGKGGNFKNQTNPSMETNNIAFSWTAPDVISGLNWSVDGNGEAWELNDYVLEINKGEDTIFRYKITEGLTAGSTVDVSVTNMLDGGYAVITVNGTDYKVSAWNGIGTEPEKYYKSVGSTLFEERTQYSWTVTVDNNYGERYLGDDIKIITDESLPTSASTGGSFWAYDISGPAEGDDAGTKELQIDVDGSGTKVVFDFTADWLDFSDVGDITYQIQIVKGTSFDDSTSKITTLDVEATEDGKYKLTEASLDVLTGLLEQGTQYSWRVKAMDTPDLEAELPLSPIKHTSYGTAQSFYMGSWTKLPLASGLSSVFVPETETRTTTNNIKLSWTAPEVAGMDWSFTSGDTEGRKWQIVSYTVDIMKEDTPIFTYTYTSDISTETNITIDNKVYTDDAGKYLLLTVGDTQVKYYQKDNNFTVTTDSKFAGQYLFDERTNYTWTVTTKTNYKPYEGTKDVFSDDDLAGLAESTSKAAVFSTYDITAPVADKDNVYDLDIIFKSHKPEIVLSDDFKMSFTDNSEPVTYTLQVKKGSDFTSTDTADSANIQNITLEEKNGKWSLGSQPTLLEGTTYFWRVAATDHLDDLNPAPVHTQYSSSSSFNMGTYSVQEAATTKLEKLDAATNDITVSWDKPAVVNGWDFDNNKAWEITAYTLSIYNDSGEAFNYRLTKNLDKTTFTVKVEDVIQTETEEGEHYGQKYATITVNGDVEKVYGVNASETINGVEYLFKETTKYYWTVTTENNFEDRASSQNDTTLGENRQRAVSKAQDFTTFDITAPVKPDDSTFTVSADFDSEKVTLKWGDFVDATTPVTYTVSLYNNDGWIMDFDAQEAESQDLTLIVSDNDFYLKEGTHYQWKIKAKDNVPTKQEGYTEAAHTTETGLYDFYTGSWTKLPDAQNMTETAEIKQEAGKDDTVMVTFDWTNPTIAGFNWDSQSNWNYESYTINIYDENGTTVQTIALAGSDFYKRDTTITIDNSLTKDDDGIFWVTVYNKDTELKKIEATTYEELDGKYYLLTEGHTYTWDLTLQTDYKHTENKNVVSNDNLEGISTSTTKGGDFVVPDITVPVADGHYVAKYDESNRSLTVSYNEFTDITQPILYQYKLYKVGSEGAIYYTSQQQDVTSLTLSNLILTKGEAYEWRLFVTAGERVNDSVYERFYAGFDAEQSSAAEVTIKTALTEAYHQKQASNVSMIAGGSINITGNKYNFALEIANGKKFTFGSGSISTESRPGYNQYGVLFDGDGTLNFGSTTSLNVTTSGNSINATAVESAGKLVIDGSIAGKLNVKSEDYKESETKTVIPTTEKMFGIHSKSLEVANGGVSGTLTITGNSGTKKAAGIIADETMLFYNNFDSEAKITVGIENAASSAAVSGIEGKGITFGGNIAGTISANLISKAGSNTVYGIYSADYIDFSGKEIIENAEVNAGVTAGAGMNVVAGIYAVNKLSNLTVAGKVSGTLSSPASSDENSHDSAFGIKAGTITGLKIAKNGKVQSDIIQTKSFSSAIGISAGDVEITSLAGVVSAVASDSAARSDVYAIYGTTSLKISDLSGEVKATAENCDKVYGLYGRNITLNNVSGTITAENGNTTAGIYADANLTLNGMSNANISGTGSGNPVFGMRATNITAENISGSTITATNNSSSVVYGIYAQDGMNLGTITNTTITAETTGGNTAYGVYAYSSNYGRLNLTVGSGSLISAYGSTGDTTAAVFAKGGLDLTVDGTLYGGTKTAAGYAIVTQPEIGSERFVVDDNVALNAGSVVTGNVALGAGVNVVTIDNKALLNGYIVGEDGYTSIEFKLNSEATDNAVISTAKAGDLNDVVRTTYSVDLTDVSSGAYTLITSDFDSAGATRWVGGTVGVFFGGTTETLTVNGGARTISRVKTDDEVRELITVEKESVWTSDAYRLTVAKAKYAANISKEDYDTYCKNHASETKGKTEAEIRSMMASTDEAEAKWSAAGYVTEEEQKAYYFAHVTQDEITQYRTAHAAELTITKNLYASYVVKDGKQSVIIQVAELKATVGAPKLDGNILKWDSVTDAVGYTVSYRKSGAAENTGTLSFWTDGTNAAATSYDLSGLLVPGAEYEFSVMAVYADGSQSAWSSLTKGSIAAKTTDDPKLGWNTSKDVTVKNGSVIGGHTGISFEWTAENTESIAYYLCEILQGKTVIGSETVTRIIETSKDTVNSKIEKEVLPTSAVVYTSDGSILSGDYTIRVTAYKADGTIIGESIAESTTIGSEISADVLAPENLLVTMTGSKAKVSWNTSLEVSGIVTKNISSYIVEYSTDANFERNVYTKTAKSATYVEIEGLSNYETYYWRVKAVTSDKASQSSWSETESFMVYVNDTKAPDAVDALEISPDSSNTLAYSFTWDAVKDNGRGDYISGLKEYVITYNLQGKTEQKDYDRVKVAASGTETESALLNLRPGVYNFSIDARDESGNVSESYTVEYDAQHPAEKVTCTGNEAEGSVNSTYSVSWNAVDYNWEEACSNIDLYYTVDVMNVAYDGMYYYVPEETDIPTVTVDVRYDRVSRSWIVKDQDGKILTQEDGVVLTVTEDETTKTPNLKLTFSCRDEDKELSSSKLIFGEYYGFQVSTVSTDDLDSDYKWVTSAGFDTTVKDVKNALYVQRTVDPYPPDFYNTTVDKVHVFTTWKLSDLYSEPSYREPKVTETITKDEKTKTTLTITEHTYPANLLGDIAIPAKWAPVDHYNVYILNENYEVIAKSPDIDFSSRYDDQGFVYWFDYCGLIRAADETVITDDGYFLYLNLEDPSLNLAYNNTYYIGITATSDRNKEYEVEDWSKQPLGKIVFPDIKAPEPVNDDVVSITCKYEEGKHTAAFKFSDFTDDTGRQFVISIYTKDESGETKKTIGKFEETPKFSEEGYYTWNVELPDELTTYYWDFSVKDESVIDTVTNSYTLTGEYSVGLWTPLEKPVIVAGTVDSKNLITLSWKAPTNTVEGVREIEYYEIVLTSQDEKDIVYTSTDTTITIDATAQKLENGIYTWKVRAVSDYDASKYDDKGEYEFVKESDWSVAEETITVKDILPPEMVKAPSVSVAKDVATIDLTGVFEDPSGLAQNPYQLVVSTIAYNTSADWDKVISVGTVSYNGDIVTVSGLDENTTYYYSVKATDAIGNTSDWNWSFGGQRFTFNTTNWSPQQKPTNLAVSVEQKTDYTTFSWTAPELNVGTNLENYTLCVYNDNQDSEPVYTVVLTGSEYVRGAGEPVSYIENSTKWIELLKDTCQVLDGDKFYTRVQINNTYSVEGEIKSAWSDYTSFTVYDITPPTAGKCTAGNLESGKHCGTFTASWDAFTDNNTTAPVIYSFEIKKSGSAKWTTIVSKSAETTATYTGLAENTDYEWRLTGYDRSKNENQTTVTGSFNSGYWLQQAAPTKLSATVDAETNDITFTWVVPAVASGVTLNTYYITLTNTDTAETKTYTVTNSTKSGSTATYTLTYKGNDFLKDATTYSWTIQAENSLTGEYAYLAKSEAVSGSDFKTYDITPPVIKAGEPKVNAYTTSAVFEWTKAEDDTPPCTYTIQAATISKETYETYCKEHAEKIKGKTESEIRDIMLSESFETYIIKNWTVNDSYFTGINCILEKLDEFDYSTTYYYRMKAADANGRSTDWITISDDKQYGSFTTLGNPGTPENITATPDPADPLTYTFSWTGTDNAKFYELQYSVTQDFSKAEKIFTEDAATTTVTVNGLKSNTTYYYRVRSYLDDVMYNYGDWTQVKNFTPSDDPGSDMETARLIEFESGGKYEFKNYIGPATGTSADPVDMFKFNFTDKAGEYYFTTTYGTLKLMDESGKTISYSKGKKINLESGVYYVSISTTSKSKQAYTFTSGGSVYPTDEKEDPIELVFEDGTPKSTTNNKIVTASDVGWVGHTDPSDEYHFINKDYAGNYTVTVAAITDSLEYSDWDFIYSNLKVQLGTYNAKGKFSAKATASYSSKTKSFTVTTQLDKETDYYVLISSADGGKSKNSNYELTVDAELYTQITDYNNDINDDRITTVVDEVSESSWVGYGDAIDFYKFTIGTQDSEGVWTGKAGMNSFTLTNVVSSNIALEIGTKTGTEPKAKFKSVAKATYNKSTKQFELSKQLDAGEYYVKVYSTDSGKKKNSDYTLTYDFTEYKYIDTDNNDPSALSDEYKIESGSTTSSWVGFGDALDYYKFNLTEYAGNCSFVLSNPNNEFDYKASNLKLEVGTLVKGKFKSVATAKLNKKTNVYTLDKQLAVNADGEYYYVKVSSTDNGKTKNSSYQLTYVLDAYDKSNYMNDTPTDAYTLNDHLDLTGTSASATSGEAWVGFENAVDYYAVEIDNAGSYSFEIVNADTLANIKFQIGTINSKGTFKALATAKSTKTTLSLTNYNLKPLSDGEGEFEADECYYVKVYSADNGKTKNSGYELNVTAVKKYDTNNTDDTIDLAKVNQTGWKIDDEAINDWVGYGDSIDYHKIVLNESATIKLSMTGTTSSGISLGLYDSNKKSVKLKNNQATLSAGTYYAMVKTSNESKYMSNYTLSLAQVV